MLGRAEPRLYSSGLTTSRKLLLNLKIKQQQLNLEHPIRNEIRYKYYASKPFQIM